MEGDDFDLRRPKDLWPKDFLNFFFWVYQYGGPPLEVFAASFADVKIFNERKL